jgi:hypothetical protein
MFVRRFGILWRAVELDVCKVEEVTECLSKKYEKLSQRRRLSVKNNWQDALTEELYHGGIRFSSNNEVYGLLNY